MKRQAPYENSVPEIPTPALWVGAAALATLGVYLIANLAVAAASEWGGAPSSGTIFPATMEVQSIKVWQ